MAFMFLEAELEDDEAAPGSFIGSMSANWHNLASEDRVGEAAYGDNKDPGKGPAGRLLSCPYRKRNPARFNVRDHVECTNSFEDLSDVKAHILNHHQRPIECARCLVQFPSLSDLVMHHNSTKLQCATVPNSQRDVEDGPWPTKRCLLAESYGHLQVSTWSDLWKLLFPEDLEVPLPTYDGLDVAEASEIDHAAPAADHGASITDSGSVSVPKPVLLGTGQPGEAGEKPGSQDDAQTTNLAEANAPPTAARQFIAQLCQEIAKRLDPVDTTPLAYQRDTVSELIHAFAISIGRESPSQLHLDAMYFVHKHQRDIVLQLASMFSRDDDVAMIDRSDSDSMSLSEKMALWESKPAANEEHLPSSDIVLEGGEDIEDDDIDHAALLAHSKVIFDSEALDELVTRLRTRSSLQWEAGDEEEDLAVNKIRQQILKALPPERISRGKQPQDHQVIFHVKPGPLLQLLFPGPAETIWIIVGSTADLDKSQFTSWQQYVSQTWPRSGAGVLELLRRIGPASPPHVVLRDKTLLTAQYDDDGDGVTITATGPARTLVECGEQLACTVAAFSSYDSWDICTSSLVPQPPQPNTALDSRPPRFGIEAADCNPTIKEHSFWHGDIYDILEPGGLVYGLPIPRRPNKTPGVEIPRQAMMMKPGLSSVELEVIINRGPPSKTFCLFKQRDRLCFWVKKRCLDHKCHGMENSKSGPDGRFPVHPAKLELEDARHFILPCGTFLETEDEGAGPASAEPRTSGSMPGETSADAGDTVGDADDVVDAAAHPITAATPPHDDANASRRAERSEPGSSSSREDRAQGIPVEHQDGRVDSSDVGTQMTASALTSPSVTDTDLDSDSETASTDDISDALSDMEQRSPAIAALRIAFVRRLLAGYHAHTMGATSSGNGATTSANPSTAPAPTASGASRPCQSTKRQQPTSDDDDSSSDEPLSKRPMPRDSSNRPTRILACPFWKAHPDKHNDCFGYILRRIRDVKQHLSRIHMPKFYCPRCKTIFPEKQDYDEHINNPAGLVCRPSEHLEGILHEKREEISKKSKGKLSEQDQWFAIWDLIFAGRRQRPPSAYRDASDSADLSAVRDYCVMYGGPILEAAAEGMIRSGEWPGFEQLDPAVRRRIMEWAAKKGFRLIIREYRRTRAADICGQSGGDGAEAAAGQYPTPSVSSLRPDGGNGVVESGSSSQADASTGGVNDVELASGSDLQNPVREREDGDGEAWLGTVNWDTVAERHEGTTAVPEAEAQPFDSRFGLSADGSAEWWANYTAFPGPSSSW